MVVIIRSHHKKFTKGITMNIPIITNSEIGLINFSQQRSDERKIVVDISTTTMQHKELDKIFSDQYRLIELEAEEKIMDVLVQTQVSAYIKSNPTPVDKIFNEIIWALPSSGPEQSLVVVVDKIDIENIEVFFERLQELLQKNVRVCILLYNCFSTINCKLISKIASTTGLLLF